MLNGGQTLINSLFSRVLQGFNNTLRVMRESKGNIKLKSEFVEMTTWASAVRPELFKLQESEV